MHQSDWEDVKVNNLRVLGFVVAMTIGAGLGNMLSFDLFAGVELTFGGAFALIVSVLVSPWLGGVVALVAGLNTLLSAGHVYVLILAVIEAVVIGLVVRSRRSNLVVSSLLFWLLIGMPLAFVAHRLMLGQASETTWIFTLKHALNGIFNASIAGVALLFVGVVRMRIFTRRVEHRMQDVIFAPLVLLIVGSSLLFVANESRSMMDSEIQNFCDRQAHDLDGIRKQLDNWFAHSTFAVTQMADKAAHFPMVAGDKGLADLTQHTKSAMQDFHNMYVADGDARTIAFYPPVNERGESTIGLDFSDRTYYRKLKETLSPVVSKVFMGRGGVFEPIVTISAPVLKENTFQGYVLAAVRLGGIQDILRLSDSTGKAGLYCLDTEGKVIASTAALEPLAEYEPPQGEIVQHFGDVALVLPGGSDSEIERFRNGRFVLKRTVAASGWTLVSVYSTWPIAETFVHFGSRGLSWLLAFLVPVLSVAYLLARLMTAPLERLAATSALSVAKDPHEAQARADWPNSAITEVRQLIESLKNAVRERSEKTEQLKALNAQLALSEMNLRITLDSIGDAVIATNVSGNVTHMNPVAERLTGWSLPEAVGHSLVEVFKIVNAHTRETVENPVEKVLAYGKIVGLANHTVLIAKDGTEYQVADSAAPILNALGEMLGVVLVFRDVTKEYAKEEQLHQAQKMEAVGQLAGGIAHDFNNLLQVILGCTEIVQASELTPEAQDSAALIMQAGERSRDLVRQLMLFSRKERFSPKPYDLNKLVGEMMKMLERVIGEQIELQFLPYDELSKAVVDRGQIEQVLMNLSLNARDAIGQQGGRIRLSTEQVTIDADTADVYPEFEPGEYALIKVEDNGGGIPVDVQKRVFEPFFTTKGVGQGSGMGLASAYAIIAHHGGRITFHSKEGLGTTFHVYLPIREATGSSEEDNEGDAVLSDTTILDGATVLLAEDDDLVLQLAQKTLSDAGCRTIVARDGDEALALFAQHRDDIDLLLFDMVMPKRNGLEVYAEISRTCADFPILFCSGYSEDVLSHEVMEGVTSDSPREILAKPYTSRSLLSALIRILSQRGQ